MPHMATPYPARCGWSASSTCLPRSRWTVCDTVILTAVSWPHPRGQTYAAGAIPLCEYAPRVPDGHAGTYAWADATPDARTFSYRTLKWGCPPAGSAAYHTSWSSK